MQQPASKRRSRESRRSRKNHQRRKGERRPKDEQAVAQQLGNIVRGLRTVRGVSINKFSALTKIGRAELRNIESGTTNLKLSRLVQLARVFRVPVSALFGLMPEWSDTTSALPQPQMPRRSRPERT